ncbi:MAG: hypothetical protein MK102_10065 [Fuerstiella sp.]|nr:hypothetical protein [Fuerstiella sp.]
MNFRHQSCLVSLAGVLCICLLAGCGEQQIGRNRAGHNFTEIATQIVDLNANVSHPNWDGSDEPIEDALANSIQRWMTHEDIVGTEFEPLAKKLHEQELEMMKVWSSPTGSIEEMAEIAKEMQATVDEIMELGPDT